MTEQLACLIHLELSKDDIEKILSELKNEKLSSELKNEKCSSYIGNWIVEKIVPREKGDFEKYTVIFDKFGNKFGVPFIENRKLKILTRYFETWNETYFELFSENIFEFSAFSNFQLFFFLAQVIYRIHQIDKSYNFNIRKVEFTEIEIKEIRNNLMNVPFFVKLNPIKKK